MSHDKILDLVVLTAKKEHLLEYETEIHGKTGKGDGYLGKITFVTLNGKTATGEKKTLNLVIKISTDNEHLRKQIPIQMLYEQEIFIYTEMLPAFLKLQEEMGFESDLTQLLPTCYATKRGEHYEGLSLENLKFKGFDMWDRYIPMSDDYVKLVLQGFAKWHAFALALRRKRPQTFKQLVRNDVPMFCQHIVKAGIVGVIHRFFENVKDEWKNEEAAQVKFSEEDVRDIFTNLCFEDENHRIMGHSDCWTNNYLFKIEETTGKPVGVYIIDWQCGGLSSPVMDLSLFIYTCVDTEKHKDVKELLEIYYTTLSEYLCRLGCDPAEVFSFDVLTEHWKRFSRYGILLGTFLLKFSLCGEEDAPDFVETAEQGKDFVENFNFNISNQQSYFKRARDNILHYKRNLD